MSVFEQRQWEVKEFPFYPERLPHTETILTVGNGLVGVRGSFEEGYPDDTPTTLVAGIFDHKEGELVPELVAMPNWLALTVTVNDEQFRLDRGTILGFERVLDLRTATLRRGVLWLSPAGTIVRFAFERFASLANPHVLALRVLVQVLSGGHHQIQVTSALDTTMENPGPVNHWAECNTGTDKDRLTFQGVTQQSRYQVAMHCALVVEGAQPNWTDTSASNLPRHTATFAVEANDKVFVSKLMALHTTRDSGNPVQRCQTTLQQAATSGYDGLKQAHDAAWAQYWDQLDIVIEGDELAQRALRFCTYHLLIATPTKDERVSIAAKTLSGFGYKGHVFWDTDLFMLPPLTLSAPEKARRLLMYRYHNLPGARAKAVDAGYQGALFPWESTDTGEETTPRWSSPDIYGNRHRIWTGENEQHISTDIAYAALQFWRWTGDDTWFLRYGAELVLDTAKFWESRAQYEAEKDRYELHMQIGPDEYHENVDNSVFTNRMVVWHMQQAHHIWQWLNDHHPDDAVRLMAALDLTDDHLAKWQDIADKMWIPVSDVHGHVFEQFEGFFDRLKPTNLEDYTPRTTNMDWIMGYDKTQVTRVIKQADVVMLMALLGEELGDQEFLQRNWEVYSKVVDHGSSLSPSVHAWVAARLGRSEEAYNCFIHSATMDLDDLKGNVRDGIHGASCGGVWQAVVFGFCGLQLTPDGPKTRPNLPEHWRRVSFTVMHNGQPVTISVPENS